MLAESLLSAGYLAYLGPLPGSYRLQAEAQWCMCLDNHDIPLAPGFTLAESLGDPTEVRNMELTKAVMTCPAETSYCYIPGIVCRQMILHMLHKRMRFPTLATRGVMLVGCCDCVVCIYVQLDVWRDAGLPQSRTAVENALIMQHCCRWTLLVDPQASTFLYPCILMYM